MNVVKCPICGQPTRPGLARPGSYLTCLSCGSQIEVPRSAGTSEDDDDDGEAYTIAEGQDYSGADADEDARGLVDEDGNEVSLADAELADDDAFGELRAARQKKKAKADKPVSAEPVKKKRKKVSTNPFDDPKILAGACGIGALCVIGIVWMVMRISGNLAAGPDGAAANQAGNAPAAESQDVDRSSQPVTLDQPVPGVVALAPSPEAVTALELEQRWFQPAPEFNEAVAAKRTAVEKASLLAVQDPTTRQVDPNQNAKAAKQEPLPNATWQAAPDPLPADARYTIAANLKFELNGPGEHRGIGPGDVPDATKPFDAVPALSTLGRNLPPILAGMNGPHMIVPPVLEKVPYSRRVSFVKGKKQSKITETKQEPIPVIDLRTGQPSGVFDWHIPFWMNPSLSPDGNYLIGPWHVPITHDSQDKKDDDEIKASKLLYVWERDETRAPKKLAMTGYVSQVEFAGPATALLLVENPQRHLEIWDVAEAKKKGAVELSEPPPKPLGDEAIDLQKYYPRSHTLVAVSCGGRYAAIAGSTGVTLVSVVEASVLGTLDLGKIGESWQGCLGMQFLNSGDDLAIALQMAKGVRIVYCGLSDGKIHVQQDFTGVTHGPLVVSPDGRSFMLCDYPFVEPPYRNAEPVFYDLDKSACERRRPRIALRWPDEGPALLLQQPLSYDEKDPLPPKVRTVVSVDRPAYETEVNRLVAFNEHNLPKRSRLTAADFSAVQMLASQPPAEWKVMPAATGSKTTELTELPQVFWPSAWSDKSAITLIEKVESSKDVPRHTELLGQLLDLSGKAPPPPFTFLPWVTNPDWTYWVHREGTAIHVGMSADGQRLAGTDPATPGRVDVRSGAGEVICSFIADPQAEHIQWLDFDDEGKLVVVAGGKVSRWEIGANSAKAIYMVEGGYTSPALFAAGRSILCVSRGGSFDMIDLKSGQCLNRCGAGVHGAVVDIAISPDGKRAAALFVDYKDKASSVLRHVNLTKDAEASVVVWDLATGKASASSHTLQRFGILSWIDADQLALCDLSTTIFDFKLGRRLVTYNLYGTWPAEGLPLERTPDGRLWLARAVPNAAETGFKHTWHLSKLSGQPSAEEAPFFAADRTIFDVTRTPLRLEIDVGNSKQAKTLGNSVVEDLQKRGYTIGPGGVLLKIVMQVGHSGTSLIFGKREVPIPQVDYQCSLWDDKGTELWKAKVSAYFRGEGSKYHIQLNQLERLKHPDEIHFDFKDKEPRAAMVDEIMEQGLGVPESLPKRLLLGGGKYASFPKTFTLDVVKPEAGVAKAEAAVEKAEAGVEKVPAK